MFGIVSQVVPYAFMQIQKEEYSTATVEDMAKAGLPKWPSPMYDKKGSRNISTNQINTMIELGSNLDSP